MSVPFEKIYQCAYCQDVLSGRVKNERVEKTYISLTGSLSIQFYDEDTDYRHYLYITPKPLADGKPHQMYFCNMQHMSDYLIYKKRLAEDKRREELREQASEEHINHLAKSL